MLECGLKGKRMKALFERTETENEIVIVQQPYMLYLILSVLASGWVSSTNQDVEWLVFASGAVWLSMILFVVWNVKTIFKTNKEIARAMKRGDVSISGSRLSFKKPMTFKIPK